MSVTILLKLNIVDLIGLRVMLACCEAGLMTVPRWYFFCRSCVLLMSCACHAFASVHCCLVVT